MKPLQFNEILKQKLWGGEDIVRIKGGDPQKIAYIGESFEISGMAGEETTVASGEFAGWTLRQLAKRFGSRLLGRKNWEKFGEEFPLLIKFISAARDLSIQVHPDDAMAHVMGHPFGKNEMWYILKAQSGANISNGFKKDFSEEKYAEALSQGNFARHINIVDSHSGDCFFIPAGRIHCISAGNFLIEIQQSSDDTFRVYDFDRIGPDGKKRELHIEQARQALSYKAVPDPRVHYVPNEEGRALLMHTPYFTSHACSLSRRQTMDYSSVDSFMIYVAFEGAARLTDGEGNSLRLPAGHSVLFPAENQTVVVEPENGEKFRFLEACIV